MKLSLSMGIISYQYVKGLLTKEPVIDGIDAMNHHNLTDMFLQLIPACYRLASIILGAYVLYLTDFVF